MSRKHRRKLGHRVVAAKKEMRQVHVKHQNNVCVYCLDKMVNIRDHPKQATLEHVICTTYYGRNNLRNTVAACADCNCARNENIPSLKMIINLIKVRKWKTVDIVFELVHWYLSINLIKLIAEVNYAVSRFETAQSNRGKLSSYQQTQDHLGQEG